MSVTVENIKKVSGVYCAIHRDTGSCYVGSSVDVGSRIKRHLSQAKTGSELRFHRYVRTHGSDSFDFELLERCEPAALLKREEFYIALLGATEVDGLNTKAYPTSPGYGLEVSETTRHRLRIASLRPDNLERLRKVSEKNKGIKRAPMTSEHRAKLSAANLGKRASEETKFRMRKSPEQKAFLSKIRYGKKCSVEHRAAIALGHVGLKKSAAVRRKMSESGKAAWVLRRKLLKKN